MNYILASSSPRRKELLKQVGIEPLILVPDVDESQKPDETVEAFIRRITLAKGAAVYLEEYYHSPIISADTIVLCQEQVIGKPQDRDEAYRFLKMLSGNSHEVWTGIALLYQGRSYYDIARTRVVFSPISEPELAHYLEHEHYMDKAGAYAIQGLASLFVKRIEGCYFNVMGFPLNLFYAMIKNLGLELLT